MEKKTLIALVAVVVLGAGAFAVMRSPEKGQRTGPAPRPIAAFKGADVAHLEVTSEKQETVVLDKQGDRWKVTKPGEWPADQAGVKSLLDGLERIGFGDQVTDKADKHAELGVQEGKAQRVVAKNASGNLLADLYLGKSVSGYTMLRPAGKSDVWQGTGMYGYMANKEPKGWREHAVFEFQQNDAEKVEIASGPAKLVLDKADKDVKVAGEAKWKVAEATGDAPKTAEALDQAGVNGAVQGMANLRATDFADDKKPASVGLETPEIVVVVTAKGKPYTLHIGSTTGEDTYVKSAGAPQIYTVKKFAIERVAHRPVDYRDKTLVKAKEDDIQSIDITVGKETTSIERAKDGTWKGKGKAALDDTKVKPVMTSFETLAGSGFAVDKQPAKTGLGKPAAQVSLRLKDKSTVTLKVGAETADKADYYVQRIGSPDVLLVKKYAVDRFMKKPSDLQKGK